MTIRTGHFVVQCVAGLFLVAIYAERMIADVRMYGSPAQGLLPWAQTLSRTGLWLWLILGGGALLFTVIAPLPWSNALLHWLDGLARSIFHDLRKIAIGSVIVVALLLLGYLWRYANERVGGLQPGVGTAVSKALFDGAREFFSDLRTPARVLLFAVVIGSIIRAFLLVPVSKDLRTVYDGWIFGWISMSMLSVLFFILSRRVVGNWLASQEHLAHIWQGLGKDLVLYTIAGALANGLLRWSAWVGEGHCRGAWTVWLVAVVTVVPAFVAAVFLDFRYIGGGQGSRFFQDFPYAWQREFMTAHIPFRSLGLIAPLVALVLVWCGWRVAHACAQGGVR